MIKKTDKFYPLNERKNKNNMKGEKNKEDDFEWKKDEKTEKKKQTGKSNEKLEG